MVCQSSTKNVIIGSLRNFRPYYGNNIIRCSIGLLIASVGSHWRASYTPVTWYNEAGGQLQ